MHHHPHVQVLAAAHDGWLVALSILIAVAASAVALDLGRRVAATPRAEVSARRLWTAGAAVVIGGGIWSMHFVAMLAHKLAAPVSYDPLLTLASLALAIGGSALGIGVAADQPASLRRLLSGGVLMGSAVAAMHYCGMAAMRLPAAAQAATHYDAGLVALSVAIAIGAATAALQLALAPIERRPLGRWRGMVAAPVMGLAIAGMHYVGMAAATFTAARPDAASTGMASAFAPGLTPSALALAVAVGTALLLAVAIVTIIVPNRRDAIISAIPPVIVFNRASTRLRLGALVAAIVLSVALIVAWVSWQARATAVAQAQTLSRNLVVTLEQHAARTIEAADLGLRFAESRIEAEGGPRQVDPQAAYQLLNELAESSPQVRSILVIDEAGIPVHDSGALPPRATASVADRDYFTMHRDRADVGLHVGKVYRNRFNGLWSMLLTRRISHADGSFAGILIAVVDPAYFRQFYEQIDVGAQGSVTLVSDTGEVLIRHPWRDEQIGASLAASPLFREHLRTAETGTYQSASVVDGVTRIFAYRKVSGLPMIAVTGIARDEVLAAWRRQTWALASAAVAVLGFMGLLAWLLARALAQHEAARSLFQTVFTHATDGLFVNRLGADGRFRIETYNAAAERALGMPPSAVVGRPLDAVLPADKAAQVEADLQRCVTAGAPIRFEDDRVLDGASQTWEVVQLPLTNADGQIDRVFVSARDITHLKQAEAAAQAANQSLRVAEQIAGIGHWRLELPARHLTWSEGVYRMHGLDPATFPLTLEAAMAVYHPDDRAEVARCVAEAIELRRDFDFSLRIRREDGALREVVCRGLCDVGPGGELTALFGTIMDVTELRQAERAVIESEARYRLLAETTNDMITRLTLDFKREYVSPACRQLLGFEPEEMLGSQPSNAIHPAEAPAVRDLAQRLVAGELPGDRTTVTYRTRHKDGRWVWVEAGMMLAHDAAGQPTSIVCSLRDISERKAAEEAQAESEARYRLLADHASDLIILGHADGRRSYISPAVRAMLGYTVEEAHQIGMREWLHPEDLAKVFATTAGLSPKRPTASVIYRLRHKAGHYIWAEAAFQRVEEDGEITIITAIRDVTERQQQAEHLEQAKVAAEAGARVKAEFLANMSHELRTPLTGMLGVHDLLQSDPALSERQRHFVGLAQESGRSLLTIVNDILDFSKIEAGQMAIEQVPFSLRDLVESCRQLGAEGIKLKGVDLTAEVAPDLPDLLLGDPTRVRQVLLNLTTNAIKFTTEGGIAVRVSRPAGRLRFSVTDTGIGVSPEVIPHLFERFSQADSSTTRRFGGTGLGLAICKRLVELMQGEIGVESAPGRGSTFWFELPLRAAEGERRQARHGSALAGAATRTWRVLLAEDNGINQEIVHAVLTRKGHSVTIVGDGAEAVAAFKAGPAYDVVLMDVQMPVMDGLAATGAIRALEREQGRPPTPVIALTANAMSEEAERCRRGGMDAHVAKPIDWTQLFATVDRLCAARAPSAAEPGRPSLPDAPPVLDESALDSLASLLGRDRISELLVSFEREMQRRMDLIEASSATAGDLAAHAHALVSLTGQLGFGELSSLFVRLEEKASRGEGLDQVGALRIAADRALEAAARSNYAAPPAGPRPAAAVA